MDYEITDIIARQAFDSRGNPTVEVEIFADNQSEIFIVPSGASTGEHEAIELRDGTSQFHGKGVTKAISNVNQIIRTEIIGIDVRENDRIDRIMIELDGTPNKKNLGANAILGVSIAAVKLAAKLEEKWIFEYIGGKTRLPCPMLNVINGGKHAGGKLAIQEFMLMPLGFDTFRQAFSSGTEVYHSLKKYLIREYGPSAINVGDEGGFAPPIHKTSDAIEALITSIREAGYEPNQHFKIGLDAAASEFYENNRYFIDGQYLSSEELIEYYSELVEQYPILLSIEDPFDENDFDAFAQLLKDNNELAIVGDDLTVTNVERIRKAINKQAMNYLLLKVNQIGTYSEAKQAFDLTRSQDWGIVISHRSGETEDTFIADLSVGWGAERIKTGAPARSERVAKYNQLLRIEEHLGEKAGYSNQI